MNKVGKNKQCGYVESTGCPLFNIAPTLVMVEDCKLTMPRYVNIDSDSITDGIVSTDVVIMKPIEFVLQYFIHQFSSSF